MVKSPFFHGFPMVSMAFPPILAPWITESPTAPSPKTATELPPSTFSVFQAAPRPVLFSTRSQKTEKTGTLRENEDLTLW